MDLMELVGQLREGHLMYFWDYNLSYFVIFIMAIIKTKTIKLSLNIQTTNTMTKIDHNCRKLTTCRILGDKRANVYVSNTIARQLWSQPWIVADNSQELLVIIN